ncbi:MAG: helix-turn-helix transcriptional regulator [Chloroflexota bacterium]|nr:helix-turn-helix transcriptional regulator [Chloroflexota bacterium]
MARFMERFERHMDADPELRAEYDRLAPRFRAISELIKARGTVSQSELARRMKVSPGVISRLESAEHDPRLGTLASAARALGYELEVTFRRQGETSAS